MITKLVLNKMLYHVGISWIICSNEKMKYEMDKNIHPTWLNKGPWYNTDICSELLGSPFEYFIIDTITDIYNIMCSIVAHDKKKLLMKMIKSVL